MGRMLAELLRWRPEAAAPAGARWSAWARALTARHARADARDPAGGDGARDAARRRGAVVVDDARPASAAGARARPRAAPARARAGEARFAPAGATAPTHAPARLAPPAPSPWSAAPFVLAAPPPSARAHERAAGLTRERSRLIVQRLVEARARREEPRGLPAPGRTAVAVAVPAAVPALPAAVPATAPAPATAASSRSGIPARARPPAMVLAAPAAAPGARDRAPDAALAALGAREHPQAARAAAAPAVQAPLDIGALADQVVRQLDRRMVAHRERMGRI